MSYVTGDFDCAIGVRVEYRHLPDFVFDWQCVIVRWELTIREMICGGLGGCGGFGDGYSLCDRLLWLSKFFDDGSDLGGFSVFLRLLAPLIYYSIDPDIVQPRKTAEPQILDLLAKAFYL